jgi:hypothetical protein
MQRGKYQNLNSKRQSLATHYFVTRSFSNSSVSSLLPSPRPNPHLRKPLTFVIRDAELTEPSTTLNIIGGFPSTNDPINRFVFSTAPYPFQRHFDSRSWVVMKHAHQPLFSSFLSAVLFRYLTEPSMYSPRSLR